MLTTKFKAIITIALFTAFAFAQTLSIQGVLRNPDGTTVDDGTYSMTFKIYEAEVGGTAIWTETHGSTSIKHGVYIVELGSITSMTGLTFNTQYYIGISVEGGQELEPRMKLANFPTSMAVLGVDNSFPSSGNVGVGTTNPQAGLHIITQNASDDLLKIESSSSNNRNIRVDSDGNLIIDSGSVIQFASDGSSLSSADFGGSASALAAPGDANITADDLANGTGNINFKIAGTTFFSIGHDGKFAIGDDSRLLDINIANTLGLYGAQDNTVGSIKFGSGGGIISGANGNIGIGTTGPAIDLALGDTDTGLDWASDGKFYLVANNADIMTVTADKIGIGTTTPDNTLDVVGTLDVSGAAYLNGIVLDNDASISGVEGILGYNDLKLYGDNSGGPDLFIGTDGKVGIGTDTPRDKLEVAGGNILADRINLGGATGGLYYITMGDNDTGIHSGGDGVLDFYTNGSIRMKLTTISGRNGYVVYDGDSNWDFYSDLRLKENIHSETNLLNRVMQLNVVNFNFKDNPQKNKEIGFIAQEVEPYFPTIVSEYQDDRYDFKVKMLGYSDFGVIAVGAIKELKKEKDAEIADLQAQIEALKAENTSAKSELKTMSKRLAEIESLVERLMAASNSPTKNEKFSAKFPLNGIGE